MTQLFVKVLAIGILPASWLLADFSYQTTTKITGGAMASMMKVAGAFSKQAREPIQATIAVKGDRMIHMSATQGSIIDLAAETITQIDFQKKQYSVMTFKEMTAALEAASQKMKDNKGAQMQYKVDIQDTGQSREIAGYATKEVIMKIIMEAQSADDAKQKANMMVTVDSWMAPKVAGYDEIVAFQKRMAEKLNWTPGGGMMTMGRPDMAKAMAEAMKEGSKLSGMPVYQVIQMGMEGMPSQGAPPAADGQPAAQPQPQQQQQSAPAEKPSVGGAVGSALGGRLGRLGGLGGLGRKKKQEDPPPAQPAAEQPPQQQAQGAPAQQPQGNAAGALMEATTEMSGFSSAAMDPAKFQVPAGFKQVESKSAR